MSVPAPARVTTYCGVRLGSGGAGSGGEPGGSRSEGWRGPETAGEEPEAADGLAASIKGRAGSAYPSPVPDGKNESLCPKTWMTPCEEVWDPQMERTHLQGLLLWGKGRNLT